MAVLPRVRNVTGSGLVISGLGVVFVAAYLVYVSLNVSYLEGPDWLFPLGLLLVSVLSVGLLYGGYWVTRSEFTAEDGWRVVIWTFAGLVGALALTFWPIFYQRIVGVTVEDPIFILLVSSGIGANAGVIAGVNEIRSERQYQQVERTRDSLTFLNRLLRHNVLNAVTIIRGNATQLIGPEQPEETVERARTIRAQSDQISDLIGNAKLLIQGTDGKVDPGPVDVVSVTRDVLETAREVHEGAVIEDDLSGGVTVRADPLLSAVVENLVTNAIVHNDRDTPRVTVTLDTRNGSAVLRIADDGPGIPGASPDEAIDPGSHGDEGLGLYLVDTLVSKYGGSLHFEERQPRGTVVTVELPLAHADPG